MNPIHRFLLAACLIWAVAAGALLTAILSQPFAGFDWQPSSDRLDALQLTHVYSGSSGLSKGAKVQAFAPARDAGPGRWLAARASLLVEEVDSVPSYAAYDTILAYNRQLYQILSNTRYYIKLDGRVVEQQIQTRPLSSIHFGYWVSALTSLIALLTGVGIWAFQPKTLATRFLLLSGFLYSFGSLLTIFYTHRHLVISPSWLEAALSIEHLLMGAFPYALLALLMSYPRRVSNTPLLATVLMMPLIFWLNETFRWSELPFHAFYLNTIVALLLALPAAISQRRAVRNNPVEIGGLRWFLLSIFTAPMVGVVFYLLPPFFGMTPQLPLWSAHLIFLTLYLGFSLGVARYRLFDIERWWFKIWISFISGVILVIVDFLLLSFFDIEADKAMMLTIAALAWIYFPLRQSIWRRLSTTRETKPEHYLPMLVEAILDKPSDKGMGEVWPSILATAFQASEIQTLEGEIAVARVTENGLFLDIPSTRQHRFIRLIGRSNGTKLFSLSDQALANSLFDLLTRMLEARTAQKRGAQIERRRIIRDLHDDVGANLLTLSYRAENERQAELARDTLKMLRETIYTLDDEAKVHLNVALAEWFTEIQARAHSAEIELKWQQDEALPVKLLRPRQRINLGRILREAISNALKHGDGQGLCVCIGQAGHDLSLRIENGADTNDTSDWVQRNGMNNIRNRVNELDGDVCWGLSKEDKEVARVYLALSIPLFA